MQRDEALDKAISLTKIALAASPMNLRKEEADCLSDFIETLTQRLENL